MTQILHDLMLRLDQRSEESGSPKELEKSYTKPVRKMPYPVFEVDPCTARGGGANHVERCSIKCLPGFKSFYFTKLEINISFSPDFKSQTTCIFTVLL